MRRMICVVAMASMATGAMAFQFSPIVMDFAPAGADSVKTFRVTNPGEEAIAVQVSVVRRSMSLHGKDITQDASEEFLVYPSQMILKPGQQQAVRVQWLGDAEIDVERAYRIIAEQLPVDLVQGEKRQGQLSIMFRYVGSLYVVPRMVRPDVRVESVRIVKQEDGSCGVMIVLYNRGNAHVLLHDLAVTLTPKDAAGGYELGPNELAGMSGENMLAQHRRRFTIDCPEGLTSGEIDATIQFEEVR
jgi:fimbrial chaperone protein